MLEKQTGSSVSEEEVIFPIEIYTNLRIARTIALEGGAKTYLKKRKVSTFASEGDTNFQTK